MKKYLLLGLCLLSNVADATDVKYKTLMQQMEPKVVLNGIPFEDKKLKFIDFEKDEKGLGYQRSYYSDPATHCTVSFYVYDQNSHEFKVDKQTQNVTILANEKGEAPIDWGDAPIETATAYSGIAYMHPDLSPKPPEMEKALADGLIVHVKKLERQKSGQAINAPISVLTGHTAQTTEGVGVTVHDGNFLKVRMTCYPSVSERKMAQAIADGAKWLRRQLSGTK